MELQSILPARWNRPRSIRPFSQGVDLVEGLHREMDQLFNDAMHGSMWSTPASLTPFSAQAPLMDFEETDDTLTLTADLPGWGEDEIEVELTDSTLRIKGEAKSEKEEKNKEYFFRERHLGSIYRAIQLPCEIDQEHVEANFKNGVLTVTLAKPAEVKEHVKHIEVKHAA